MTHPHHSFLLAILARPVAEQRRICAVLAKSAEPETSLQELRNALSEDLQPLGKALFAAYQTGDLPAMQAALKKISEEMPTLTGPAENLTEALAETFSHAWLGTDTRPLSASGTHGGAEKGWITRRAKGTSREGKTQSARDAFGPLAREGMTPEQAEERLGNLVNLARRNQQSIHGAAWRKELGMVDLPWGRPGHSFPVQRGQTAVTHTDGYGLSHILEKHGSEAARSLPKVIVHGEIRRHAKDPLKREIHHQGKVVILGKENAESSYAITSYNLAGHPPATAKPLRPELSTPTVSKVRQKRMDRAMERERKTP